MTIVANMYRNVLSGESDMNYKCSDWPHHWLYRSCTLLRSIVGVRSHTPVCMEGWVVYTAWVRTTESRYPFTYFFIVHTTCKHCVQWDVYKRQDLNAPKTRFIDSPLSLNRSRNIATLCMYFTAPKQSNVITYSARRKERSVHIWYAVPTPVHLSLIHI